MVITENGYTLLKDSYIEADDKNSFRNSTCCVLKQKLISKSVIKDSKYNNVLIATEDIPFKSPSSCAAVVRGTSINGRAEWKLQDGTTLDDFESSV